MIPWTEMEVRKLEHERRVQRVEEAYWMQIEAPVLTADRWYWRAMSQLGGWLVALGCRLQTHVEHARQVMRASHMAVETNSNSTQPCP